jgi:hypothetical protein
VVVASLPDTKLRAAANRLLSSTDWVGEPRELFETAEDLLR